MMPHTASESQAVGPGIERAENPFASRFVRPGVLPYLLPFECWQIDSLVERLAANDWRGAVVGPHGSGKSTLLASLAASLRQRGIVVVRWPDGCVRVGSSAAGRSVLLVDGYDSLSSWRRWCFRRRCQLTGRGLVVTGHDRGIGFQPVLNVRASSQPTDLRQAKSPSHARHARNLSYLGLPVLMTTSTSIALAEQIAAALAGEAFASAARACIRDSFRRHGGNLREVLFDLYDLYERKSRHERNECEARRRSCDLSLVE